MRNLRLAKHEQAARTRARLLQAAADVFAHKGYDDTTIDDICLAADRARGAFYVHFRSRSDIFLGVLRGGAAHPRILADALARAARSGGDAPELRAILGARLPDVDELKGLMALGRTLLEVLAPTPAAAPSRRRRAA